MQKVCMTVILAAACWFDIRCRRIPNQLILTGWIISLALTGWQQGLPGLFYSISGILIIIIAGWPFYRCRAIGAGDIKLLSVLAGIHGLKRSVRVVAICIPLAAVAGLLVLAGSLPGIRKRIPLQWKDSLCARKKTGEDTEKGTESEKRKTGRYKIILAPFLTLAYLWG